jgi:transcriptional regulator with XRE-family HTH domain
MQRSSIHPLRQAREAKNLTLQALADAVGLSEKTIWSAEHNQPVGLYTRKKLCKYFRKTAQELGIVVNKSENNTSAENLPIQVPEQKNERTDKEAPLEHNQGSKRTAYSSFAHSHANTEEAAQLSSAIKDGILMAVQELGEKDLDELRRKILQATLEITVGKTSIEQIPFLRYSNPSPFTSPPAGDVSDQVIRDLAVKTQNYRDQQRTGITIEKDVKKHISDIQEKLESTANQEKRRKLWTILQKRERHEPHAAAIIEYSHKMPQQQI